MKSSAVSLLCREMIDPREPERKEQLQPRLSSGSQPPPATKDLPSPAQQPCGAPSPSSGRELGSKPWAAEPSLGLPDPPRPAAVRGDSSLKPGPAPDPSPAKSKHPDRPLASQRLGLGAAVAREPGTQPPSGPSPPSGPGQDGKGSSKGVSNVYPALPGSQNTASHVIGQAGSGPSGSLPPKAGPLDTKLKPTDGGRAPEALERLVHPPRQGHPGVSESVDQKLPTVSEKLNLSPKHPKPPTVRDGPPPCRQTDKSPSPLATTADRKSEGKRCMEALYGPTDSRKLEASLPPAQGEARLRGTERPAGAAGKGLPDAKGRGLGAQKPPPEAGKPSGMKRSPSAIGQSSFRPTALPEKCLSASSSFPEARPGAREAPAASGDPAPAKASGATAEPTAPSSRDQRKPPSGGDGGSHMTKSDSLPSFRSSSITVELQHPNPSTAWGAGPRDRALSVTAPPGETKEREPAPAQPQTRKQNAGREVTKPSPAPGTDRPVALPPEKDSVVRQRRGKESLRSSPHKKAS